MSGMPPRAFLVIPAYRETARLPRLLAQFAHELVKPGRQGIRLLIVDDGSPLAEADAIGKALAAQGLSPAASLLRLGENRGKGAALRRGLEEGLASGAAVVGFLDGDGSVSAAEALRALERLEASPGLSGVIGSRVLMLGRKVERRPLRHYAGRVFATFVSLLYGVPAYDTQCGLKLFRSEPLRRHIGAPLESRWAWDTQLLLALLRGEEAVEELPIDWSEAAGSKLSLLDAPRALWDLARFRFGPWRRVHGPR